MENDNVTQESTPAMSANQGFGDRLESEVKNLLDQQKIINGVTLIALQWFFLNYYKRS